MTKTEKAVFQILFLTKYERTELAWQRTIEGRSKADQVQNGRSMTRNPVISRRTLKTNELSPHVERNFSITKCNIHDKNDTCDDTHVVQI